MNDNSAIPGGAVFESFKKLTEQPIIKEITKSQSSIASLVTSDGFKALQEVIDREISVLQDIPIDQKTDTPESIGFRYLASRITIDYLKSIRDLPKRQAELAESSKEDER